MKKSSRDHRKWIREIRTKFRKDLQSGGIGDIGPRGYQGNEPVNPNDVYQWDKSGNPDITNEIKELQDSLDDIFGVSNIKVEHKKRGYGA
jgi:hypothetical protein